MIVGIELSKKYVQISVKTNSMREPESVTKIAGTEHYRMPYDTNLEDRSGLQELFRKLWKMLAPYGNKESLEYLVFCLEENTEQARENLKETVRIYHIPEEKIRFLDKAESFCAYVFHQSAELLTHNALLIENQDGKKEMFLLHKRTRTLPVVAEVRKISEEPLESVFSKYPISSVFLLGDDFELDWMERNLKILRNGKRIFVGKNLYVKGAAYRGMELAEEKEEYLYLGAEKNYCHLALRVKNRGAESEFIIAEGGKNWYESDVELEVLLEDEPEVDFVMIPINGKEKKTVTVHLEKLPKRPKRTTRLSVEINFQCKNRAKFVIKDLGFGELFPRSDVTYEGELQWEQ